MVIKNNVIGQELFILYISVLFYFFLKVRKITLTSFDGNSFQSESKSQYTHSVISLRKIESYLVAVSGSESDLEVIFD